MGPSSRGHLLPAGDVAPPAAAGADHGRHAAAEPDHVDAVLAEQVTTRAIQLYAKLDGKARSGRRAGSSGIVTYPECVAVA